MKVTGFQNADLHCMYKNILQNIFFCVPQNKQMHTCLEQREVE